MPKLTGWGGDLDSNSDKFQELEKALKGSPDELFDIVDQIMYFHYVGAAEPGINVFNGGNVQLDDDARLYKLVKRYVDGGGTLGYLYGGNFTRGGTRKYSQSHPTNDTPYEVTMPAGWFSGWGCILFGTHDNGTWFQTEATSVKRGYGSMAYHTVVDFANYKMSGKQQGPIGTSVHSDKNPIRVHRLDCYNCPWESMV